MWTGSVNRRWLIVIGLGLALIPIHNELLTNLATIGGRTVFFIPTFGFLLLTMGAAFFMLRNWEKVKQNGLGDKKIWIPLLIIVAAMALSGINAGSIRLALSPLFMGVALFAVYIISRILGDDTFAMLMPFVVVGSVSIIISGVVSPGAYTGGFITNYCASAGYLIFGVLVYRGKWKLPLVLLALVALFFIGALEAVFIMGILLIYLIIRRDFSKQFFLILGALIILAGIWAALGYLTPLYEGNQNLTTLHNLIRGKVPLNWDTAVALTTGRWVAIVEAVRNFSFIGHGYSLSTVGGGIVHNVPLIIMHQIGPFAALAWLFVSIYCIFKTGWEYAWMAVLAVAVWDHYLWTQFAPWWWALIGVSTASSLKSDLIFKGVVISQ